MDRGKFTFVVNIPPKFQGDIEENTKPDVQIVTDATAMSQAGRGPGYIQQIINNTVAPYWNPPNKAQNAPLVTLETRARFNPNMYQGWFVAINQVINNISVLAIFLCGAAVLREREHGNIEHLLVMPLRPFELMFAKIWANGLVIVVVATLSLWIMVHGLLQVPLAGSMLLFLFGTVLYQFSVGALGILLATFTGTMGQFGLLVIPVLVVLNLLSGSTTPMESIPTSLQYAMQLMPTPHFVGFAQAVLYRGAGVDIVWPQLTALAVITIAFLAVSLMRFRTTIASFG